MIITFIFLFLIFAVLHSLLATDYIKKKIEKQLKFRFYRIIYNIISLITFTPVFLIWITSASPLVYSVKGWLYPFFILIRLAAIGLFVYAAFQNDPLAFAGLRQITGKSKNMLITKGAYGIVRHPLYTGGIIMLLTKIDMRLLDLAAVSMITIYLIIGAYIEETRLLSVFGEEYRKYQQEVSMFIPVKWIMKSWKLFKEEG